MDSPTDQDLLNRIAQRDDQAAKVLYERHHGYVRHFARQHLRDDAQIEEVVQDVFISIFRKPLAFQGESRLSTYLCTIARRRVMDIHRSRYAHPEMEAINEEHLENTPSDSPEADVETTVARRQAGHALQGCLEKLPMVQREAFFWAHVEECTDTEVAQRLQVAVGTVKSRLHAARQALKRCLSAHAPGGVNV